jgi:hypothetical protein
MHGLCENGFRGMALAMKLGRKGLCAAAAVAVMGLAQSAWAQGCVMCYTSASALGKRGIHYLDAGIIVLFFPPVLIFAGILYFLHRRSSTWAVESDEQFTVEFGAPGNQRAV